MINLALIEDDIELRDLLEKYLNHQENMNCIIAVESVEEFLELAGENKPDIIISDIGLPGISGDEGLLKIKKEFPASEVVMLTVHDDSEKIFACLQNGASGYILKNSPLEEIRSHLEVLVKGGAPMSPSIARKVIECFQPVKKLDSPLTNREYDIVKGLVDGMSYKMIADEYNISIDTVRQHIRNIYKKLNVNSKAEVIAKKLRGEI